MGGEEKVYAAKSDKVAKTTAEAGSPEPTVLDAWEDWQRAKRELASAPDEPEYESVELTTDEQMEALSDEELDQHIDLQEKQVKLNELQEELNRRALNLGLLKLANKAPRCSYLKSNGQPCRAPAMGNTYFCVFHVRSMDQENSRLRVELLENRESLQLTVKQIMEQIVRGQLDPQTASLLLRAVQIANSTQKPRRIRAPKRKSASGESDAWGNPRKFRGNAVENSALPRGKVG